MTRVASAGPMCITKSLVALDPMHTTTSLDALKLVSMTCFLGCIGPDAHHSIYITVCTLYAWVDDGVCKTAAVFAVIGVVGS